ncbi:hypothetical protein LTS18_014901, partial [Coniosporium uncinatum]
MLNWDKAMHDWATQNPEHTAREWEEFFRKKVQPFYNVTSEYTVWKKVYFGAWAEWNEKNPRARLKSWLTHYWNNLKPELEKLNAPKVSSSIVGLVAEDEPLKSADTTSNKKRTYAEMLEKTAPNVENRWPDVKRQRVESEHVFQLKEVAIPPSQHGTPQKPAPMNAVIDISDDASDDENGSDHDSDLPEDAAKVSSEAFVSAVSEQERKDDHFVTEGEGSTVPCEEPDPQPPLEIGEQADVEDEGDENLETPPPEE